MFFLSVSLFVYFSFLSTCCVFILFLFFVLSLLLISVDCTLEFYFGRVCYILSLLPFSTCHSSLQLNIRNLQCFKATNFLFFSLFYCTYPKGNIFFSLYYSLTLRIIFFLLLLRSLSSSKQLYICVSVCVSSNVTNVFLC